MAKPNYPAILEIDFFEIADFERLALQVLDGPTNKVIVRIDSERRPLTESKNLYETLLERDLSKDPRAIAQPKLLEVLFNARDILGLIEVFRLTRERRDLAIAAHDGGAADWLDGNLRSLEKHIVSLGKQIAHPDLEADKNIGHSMRDGWKEGQKTAKRNTSKRKRDFFRLYNALKKGRRVTKRNRRGFIERASKQFRARFKDAPDMKTPGLSTVYRWLQGPKRKKPFSTRSVVAVL
jgi:hypothetical protein